MAKEEDKKAEVADTKEAVTPKKGAETKASNTYNGTLEFTTGTPSIDEIDQYGYSWDQDTLTLTLNGIYLIAANGCGIQICDGATINIVGENSLFTYYSEGLIQYQGKLTVNGDKDSLLIFNGENDYADGFYCPSDNGDLTINGGMYKGFGTDYGYAYLFSGANVHVSNATVFSTLYNSAFYGTESLTIENSNLTLDVTCTGLRVESNGAKINIKNSKIDILTENTQGIGAGIYARGDKAVVSITDSDVIINNTADHGIQNNFTYNSPCGIQIGGQLIVDNSSISSSANGYGIFCLNYEEQTGTKGITLKNCRATTGGTIQSVTRSQGAVTPRALPPTTSITTFGKGQFQIKGDALTPINASKKVVIVKGNGEAKKAEVKKKGTAGKVVSTNLTNADTGDKNVLIAILAAILSVIVLSAFATRRIGPLSKK